MPSSIHTHDLTRVFRIRQTENGRPEKRELTAVDRLNLSVPKGSLYGLLGRNGAGKTTLVRMLSTLLLPTSGKAIVAGFDVAAEPDQVRRHIGCLLPGERTHYWKLTARENLNLFAALYGIPRKLEKRRVEEVLEIADLRGRADERVENYSTGMRQRLALARALLHDPPVLFLDEPTSGLDVPSARAFRLLVMDLAAAGKTILLTTHNLSEAQDVCSRVGIIHEGHLVAEDTPKGLRDASGGMDVVEIRCQAPHSPLEAMTRVAGSFSVTAEPDGEAWRITVKGPGARTLIPELAPITFQEGWRLLACDVMRPDLEDVFVQVTRGRDGR